MKIIEKSKGFTSFFDNYPIDLHIRIYSKGSIFKAEVRPSGTRPQSFDIRLTAEEVEELNKGLQQEIEQVSQHCGEAGVSEDALLQLATAGQAAFNRIFGDGPPRQTMLDALKILQGRADPTIEISTEASDKFFIPWEMLYNGPALHTKANVQHFWGMRYIISRTIVQEASPGSMVSPVIEASRPYVGLVTCDELQHVIEKEIPALRSLHENKRIDLIELPYLSIDKQSRELEQFGRFLHKKHHIIHFACHAFTSDPSDLSVLRVSSRFEITMRDFHARRFAVPHHPFIILNACRTGMIDPLRASSWATLFWKYGARGVLATEFRIPDNFAASFITELYKPLLSGKPIGEALLFTRRYFWDGQRNPLGLAYALYSPLAIRIKDANSN